MTPRYVPGVRALVLILSALIGAAPQVAQARHSHAHSQSNAGPALWTVHGTNGTVYLFGSVHVLPPGLHWKTAPIMAAMKRSDTFVFEIPLDHQQTDAVEALAVQKQVMDLHGMLPPGQSLRGSLPQQILPKYDAALELLEISPGYVDRLQPWLVSLILENAQLYQTNVNAVDGVDRQVFAIAQNAHKPSHGLETLEQQLAIITPSEQKVDMTELDRVIEDCNTNGAAKQLDAIVAAWAKGDVAAIQAATIAELKKDPVGEKSLLDDRNARWVPQIEKMLADRHTYFVTVGVAHLVGPGGVPNLLRQAGYIVSGP
jgi:uncharacterized protein YbaP (TraB family)